MAKRILIVDDDSELCEEMEEALRNEGYFVRSLHEGKECEKITKSDPYDILLLDFKMPGLNCADALKSLKEHNPSTRIFLMSGKPFIDKFLEENKLNHLIEGFMNKPFEVEKLLEKIKAIE